MIASIIYTLGELLCVIIIWGKFMLYYWIWMENLPKNVALFTPSVGIETVYKSQLNLTWPFVHPLLRGGFMGNLNKTYIDGTSPKLNLVAHRIFYSEAQQGFFKPSLFTYAWKSPSFKTWKLMLMWTFRIQARASCLCRCQAGNPAAIMLHLPQCFIFLLETHTAAVAAKWTGKHWETADL